MTDRHEPQTREEILDSYLKGPSRLRVAVGELTDTQLDLAPSSGGWTIREIVHHIVDGDDIWDVAIKAAFGNPQTHLTFSWYWDIKQDEWARHWDYAARPVAPSLELFTASRAHIAQLLQMQPDAWGRCVIIDWPKHPAESANVGEMIASQARHAHTHIDDILAILREQGMEHDWAETEQGTGAI